MTNNTKLQMLLSLVKSGQVKVEDIKDEEYKNAVEQMEDKK